MSQSGPVENKRQADMQVLAAALQQMATVQAEENDVKRHELTVREAEISANRDIALASIKAQSEFHAGRGSVLNRQQVQRYVFTVVVLLVVLGFSAWMFMHEGKELVISMAQHAFVFATGAFGGYHFGKNRGAGSDQESEN